MDLKAALSMFAQAQIARAQAAIECLDKYEADGDLGALQDRLERLAKASDLDRSAEAVLKLVRKATPSGSA